jgi:hypothetical protein
MAFEVAHRLSFGTPCVNHKRNLASPPPAFEVAHRLSFGIPCVNYKRNLASPPPAFEVAHRLEFGKDFVRVPSHAKIYSPSVLIDVRFGALIPGDSGAEITYNIQNRLRIRPRLLAPENGALERLGSPAFRWVPTVEAEYYEVHIALDDRFTQRVARFNTQRFDIVRGLEFGRVYYWRVRAVAGTAWSDYSEVWSFSIPELTPAPVVTHEDDGGYLLLNQFRKGT